MRRRSHFTLIEMMISLAFLTLLLSSLFIWYRHLTLGREERMRREWRAKEELYLDLQLGKILPNANLKPCFFTSEQEGLRSLVFSFDNGAQEEKMLSGSVLGKIFLDESSHTLCLGIWPNPETREKFPCETRVLLEGVKTLSFEFYFPPNALKLGVDPQKVGAYQPREGWQQEWESSYALLPPMMQVIIERLPPKEKKEKEKKLIFSYELPFSSASQIVYVEGK